MGVTSKTVYVVTMRCGEDLSDDWSQKYDRQIMMICESKEGATWRRDLAAKECAENGFDDCQRFYVEPWAVLD